MKKNIRAAAVCLHYAAAAASYELSNSKRKRALDPSTRFNCEDVACITGFVLKALGVCRDKFPAIDFEDIDVRPRRLRDLAGLQICGTLVGWAHHHLLTGRPSGTTKGLRAISGILSGMDFPILGDGWTTTGNYSEVTPAEKKLADRLRQATGLDLMPDAVTELVA